jgi:hypothetical protein
MSDLPQAENVSANPTQSSKSSRRTLFIILGVLAGFVVLCGLGLVLVFGGVFLTVKNTSSDVKPVLEQFMQAMERKDANAAYALFSQRAQQQIGVANVEALLSDTNYPLFEGYQSLTITGVNVSTRATSNQNEAQGVVATVSGKVGYQGGIEGSFEATLEQNDGEWGIHLIDVTVPPEKLR